MTYIPSTSILVLVHLLYELFTGAPNGSVPQNIFLQANFCWAGRFGKNAMSLEGT